MSIATSCGAGTAVVDASAVCTAVAMRSSVCCGELSEGVASERIFLISVTREVLDMMRVSSGVSPMRFLTPSLTPSLLHCFTTASLLHYDTISLTATLVMLCAVCCSVS